MRRSSNGNRPDAATGSVSRRTLVSWLGSSTVLALTPALVAACRDERLRAGGGSAGAGGAGGGGSIPGVGGTMAGGEGGEPAGGGFAFQPGASLEELLGYWKAQIVDPQDLESVLAAWELSVDGMVAEPRVLSFADLVELPRQDQVVDFHCVEGWSIHDVPWNGVHLGEIVRLVQPAPEATHVTFHCIGGVYSESIPWTIALEPKTMLAYGINGATLPVSHGFPLRVVIPRLFGYKSAKYLQRIEFTDHAVEGYWVSRGYTYSAEVQASRLRPGKY